MAAIAPTTPIAEQVYGPVVSLNFSFDPKLWIILTEWERIGGFWPIAAAQTCIRTPSLRDQHRPARSSYLRPAYASARVGQSNGMRARPEALDHRSRVAAT